MSPVVDYADGRGAISDEPDDGELLITPFEAVREAASGAAREAASAYNGGVAFASTANTSGPTGMRRVKRKRLLAQSKASKLWKKMELRERRSGTSRKPLPTCSFCASTKHTRSVCPLAVNKFTFAKATSQWSDNGFDLVDVPGDGNCYFHSSMPLADFML